MVAAIVVLFLVTQILKIEANVSECTVRVAIYSLLDST